MHSYLVVNMTGSTWDSSHEAWLHISVSNCVLQSAVSVCGSTHLHPCSPVPQEIDYINEGKNADRFRRNFRAVEWVEAPVVHWGATSARVITLSYLPGVKVSTAANSGLMAATNTLPHSVILLYLPAIEVPTLDT